MTYFSSVRHPWPCLALLVPLLGAYEIISSRTSGANGESLRAGVDLWLRKWLSEQGTYPPILIPAAILFLLVAWTIRRWADRPQNVFVPVFGIAIESVAFGLALWAICLNAPGALKKAGLVSGMIDPQSAMAVTFVGVGIYEEVIFRLIGVAMLAWFLRMAFFPGMLALPVALIASAIAFATAHHLVHTDPFVPSVFLMRAVIGVYCGIVFVTRGIGVAVGTHIVYDIIVSMPR